MEGDTVRVTRGIHNDWLFTCIGGRWLYHTRQNTYRLFFDEGIGCVWIGRLHESENGSAWLTAEREIHAEKVLTLKGTFQFRK